MGAEALQRARLVPQQWEPNHKGLLGRGGIWAQLSSPEVPHRVGNYSPRYR